MAHRLISIALTFACLALAVVLWLRRSDAPVQDRGGSASSLSTSTSLDDAGLLDRKIAEIRWDNVTLDDALMALADLTNVNISANWRTLEGAGILRSAKVRVHLKNVSLRQALESLLMNLGSRDHPPAYFVDHGVVTVTSAEDAGRNTVTEMINVRPLLDEMWKVWSPSRPFELRERTGPTREEPVDALLKFIADTVAPDSWLDAGGVIGSIREMAGVLIITQTPKNIAEIHRVLVRYRQVLQATGAPP